MSARAAVAFVALLVAGVASATQDGEAATHPVQWDAPQELRVLFEQHLPPPPVDARDDRGALRRWMRDARRRTVEIAAAEGWFSAQVEVTEAEGRVRVALTPGERATVGSVTIEFQGDLGKEGAFRASRRGALEQSWLLGKGKVFRQADWDEAKARLIEALTADDYAAGELAMSQAQVDAASAQVSITLVLDSGPAFSLGEVQVTGLSRYPKFLVDRALDIDPGEPYRTDRLLELQRNLQSAPWFANVVVEIERDRAHPVRVPVRISILERPAADVGLSLGYGSDVGARGEVSFRYRNAFGRGYDMHSAMQVDKTQQVGYADFYLPTGTLGGAHLGTLATRDSFGFLAEHKSSQGLDTRRGAVAGYRQLFFEKLELRLGVSFQVEQATPGGGETSVNRALAPVGQLTWRPVDDVLNPTRGGVLNVQLAGGSKAVLSSQDFIRTYAQYQHWFALSPVDQVIVRAEGGYTIAPSSTGIPEDFLFRAGGSRSVRGYEYESLGPIENGAVVGGRYLATGSVEYVRWFSPRWGGALFLDAGDAADAVSDLRVNKGYGVGVRWRTPAGPLAVDLAYADRDRKARLVFSVSVAF
ncbi:MAG: BamA/TamA family outer membrane protein [Betaproteobacteria bacterium]|nr:BamA/TamA family outer membrane protein [Betaproteobacteria bacterium]